MVNTEVSTIFSVGVALALLAPRVLAQGGGMGAEDGSSSSDRNPSPAENERTFGQATFSSWNSNSTLMTYASYTATRGVVSTTTAVSTSMAPPQTDGASEEGGMLLPQNITSTATAFRTTTSMEPPPTETSEDSALPPRDATTVTSTTISSMDSLPPPDGSEDTNMAPENASQSSMEEGSGVHDSANEIYFPSDYTAECDHYGEDSHYAVKFSGSGEKLIRQVWSETGCSNSVNWGVDKGPDYHFPGRVVPSNASIPAYPMMIGGSGTTDLSETNGEIAILVNGVAMFSAWATEPAVDYESTAFYLEGDTLDACGGHATTEGWYHYHGTPGCLEEQVMKGEGLTFSDHSPFLGWSYDGFPMYGHLGPDGIQMRACDTTGADETYCLDSCSGYEGEIPEIDGFTYRYYLTCGYDESFFPMTVNCFRGCCPDGIECSGSVEACDDTAEQGYSSTYEPELGYIYSDMYDVDALAGDDADYINSSTLANCTMFYDEDLEYIVEQVNMEDFPSNPSSPGPTPSPTLSMETRARESSTTSPNPGTFEEASAIPSPQYQSARTPSPFLKESMWAPTLAPGHAAGENEGPTPSTVGSFMAPTPGTTDSFVGPAFRRSISPTYRKSQNQNTDGGSMTATPSPIHGVNTKDAEREEEREKGTS